MEPYKIGTPLQVNWHLTMPDGTSEKPFSIDGLTYKLEYKTGRGKCYAANTTMVTGASSNILQWTFSSAEQIITGIYDLVLTLYKNGNRLCQLTYQGAFALEKNDTRNNLVSVGSNAETNEGTQIVNVYSVGNYWSFTPVEPVAGSNAYAGYWVVNGTPVKDSSNALVPTTYKLSADEDGNILIYTGAIGSTNYKLIDTLTTLPDALESFEEEFSEAELDRAAIFTASESSRASAFNSAQTSRANTFSSFMTESQAAVDAIESEAEGYADEAEGYRDETLGYKNDVITLKSQVQGLKSDTQSLKNDTETYKNIAVTQANNASGSAQSAATALSGAQSAKQDAVNAKETAAAYKTAAETAKDAAVSAKNAAVNAQGAAENALSDAEEARDEAAESAESASASATSAAGSATAAAASAVSAAASAAEAADKAPLVNLQDYFTIGDILPRPACYNWGHAPVTPVFVNDGENSMILFALYSEGEGDMPDIRKYTRSGNNFVYAGQASPAANYWKYFNKLSEQQIGYINDVPNKAKHIGLEYYSSTQGTILPDAEVYTYFGTPLTVCAIATVDDVSCKVFGWNPTDSRVASSVMVFKKSGTNYVYYDLVYGEEQKKYLAACGIQSHLVSGTNIKTINGEDILGSGNITIQGGGGTSDYSNLSNKPKINNVELSGNKSISDLGLQAAISDLATIRSGATAGSTALQSVPDTLEMALFDLTSEDAISMSAAGEATMSAKSALTLQTKSEDDEPVLSIVLDNDEEAIKVTGQVDFDEGDVNFMYDVYAKDKTDALAPVATRNDAGTFFNNHLTKMDSNGNLADAGVAISVVTALPTTPDSNTIYFVTES